MNRLTLTALTCLTLAVPSLADGHDRLLEETAIFEAAQGAHLERYFQEVCAELGPAPEHGPCAEPAAHGPTISWAPGDELGPPPPPDSGSTAVLKSIVVQVSIEDPGYGSVSECYADDVHRRECEITLLEPEAPLMLFDDRFEIVVGWETFAGATGIASVVPFGDGGDFWFFSVMNRELFVKMIDACTFNDRFWVFAAGLTDVGVVIQVTELETGLVREYESPLGTAFAPIQDTDAFRCTP